MRDKDARPGGGDLDEREIRERIEQYAGRAAPPRLRIFDDTTEFMDIGPGDIIAAGDCRYYVFGNAFEGRFGIDDQPKFWVKRALDLHTGERKFIKLVFNEEMITRVGPFAYRCRRSVEKEARVLDIAQGDDRFMQGRAVRDAAGNILRVLDTVYGRSLYHTILDLDMTHEEYFHNVFPGMFVRLIESIEAILFLHANSICHGDIRNDHILIDRDTGRFRWIDFDLQQYTLDFDVWCLGNLLTLVVGGGEVTFHGLRQGIWGSPEQFDVSDADASAFFPQRIANLCKIFPYIPESLNRVLARYSRAVEQNMDHYKSAAHLLKDLNEVDLVRGA